ncbi:hypothetical protein [Gordonia sp. C13]|uniref:hypothetical protein n=1 Tax=Gordonia sp. C13 TaxID=2935078 RepID=UPI0012B7460A|nr:hypothetical protein [Gordonia sp. C13]MCK8616632.1 hypothetical protein [Gordonia sp. C13]
MTAHDNGSESEDSGTENELTTASDKADRGDATSATEPATSQDVSASHDDASPTTSEAAQRWGSARLQVVAVGALVAVLAVLAGLFAYLYIDMREAKTSVEDAATQRAQAAQAASDYTTKSLTYSYQNTGAFFTEVKENASDALVKRYDDVEPTLTQIMKQAKVQASGRVLATSVTGSASENRGEYTVLVFATQKTQNVQNPHSSELPTLLKVVVLKTENGWQIQDYGPAE